MDFPSEVEYHVATDERLKPLKTGRNVLNMQKLFKKVMRRSNRRWGIGFSVAALLVSASFGQVSTGKVENKNQPSKDRVNLSKIQTGFISGPVAFEVNRGQTDANVKFLTRAQNFTVYLMPGETVLRGVNADVLRMKLQGANKSATVQGEDKLPRVSNYYMGNDRSKWLKDVPNYSKVRFQDVYSGIDMVYHSDQQQLEYDFVVKPGADLNQIKVAFEGASKVEINSRGELELQSAAGNTLNHKPVVYQMINGHRKMVDGEYALANNTVGFKVGAYDRTQPLIIDPTLQVLSFFGGTLNDEASGIAVSAFQASPTVAGVVIIGRSQSPSLPPGVAKPAGSINWDSFAVGLNGPTPGIPAGAGTTVLWTTYFGGSGDDAARGVAMDNQGNVYIAGYTNSSNFPVGFPSSYDAYLVKLGAAGGSLSGGTLYGGNLVDMATSVALDYSTFSKLANAVSITNPATDPQVTPNVVIGGVTSGGIGQAGSPAATTATPDGNQKTFNNCTSTTGGCGLTDGFVAIFSSSLALQHATYIGGGGNDQVNGVAVDVWGNIYATGFATPNVAPNFPVTRGIAVSTARPGFDAAQVSQNNATAFVAKWTCTTGGFGVPSPPFGITNSAISGVNSQMPTCGGSNNLATLGNSALFGGSAAGNTFINPQQTVLGQPGITEAGMGIAVDQNGWGQTGVAGANGGPTTPGGPAAGSAFGLASNGAGFPDIVPISESGATCNTGATGTNGFGVGKCAVSRTGTNGGFQPGVSGPHVYIVGSTASRDFVNSLVFAASCKTPPFVSSTAVPAVCPTPEVFGAGIVPVAAPTNANFLPGRAYCDPLTDAGGSIASNCPSAIGGQIADLRVKTVTGGSNSGQTQGWLASFQFPAITQVASPAGSGTVTTLNPPTVPNYIVLQPATCPAPSTSAGTTNTVCIQGEVATPLTSIEGQNATTAAPHASVLTAATQAPPPFFGCNGVTCPTAFMGGWNAVTVDSDQQVYVIGQIGMSPGTAPGLFGTGTPNRLALEIERIAPYANTSAAIGASLQPNFCPGGSDAPCAFPLEQFASSGAFGTDFLVDSVAPGTGPGLNSNYGFILPGAPPLPNPNQEGGLGNGIAVNPLREAFFVGTSTELTAPITAPATAGAVTTAAGVVTAIAIATPGSGYTVAPTCTIVATSGGGSGATCTTTITGGAVTAINVTNGGTGYNTLPVVTIGGPIDSVLNYLVPSPITAAILPVLPTQGNLGAAGGGLNRGESCAAPPCTGTGPEDLVYGAIQFYDAIATPTVVNFTATVNNFNSITGPNGQTGVNAKAVINYTNWEGQALNIPPGCTITPNVPTLPGYPVGPDGTSRAFTVTQISGTSVFQVTVNSALVSGVATGVVSVPGVVTSLITFTKSGPCTGVGQPFLDSWDPLTVTLSVSAPMSLSPENTFVVTSRLATGIVDQYLAGGTQLVANSTVNTGIDVSTSNSNGPINFTAQIVPGSNWQGSVTGAVTMPTPTDIIYTAGGPSQSTRVPIAVNTGVLAGLPQGTYTAWIMFVASPETPVLPTSGSTACTANTVPILSGTTSPACIPISITITGGQVANSAELVFGSNVTTPEQTQVPISNPTSAPYSFTAGYQATPVYGTALPAANVFFVGTGTTLIPANVGPPVTGTVPANGIFSLPVQINPVGLATGVYSGQILLSNNGQATGATAQTTVPIIVYVGPRAGEDTPSGNGLGLMLPVNVPPIGTGGSQGAAPGTPGSYPLVISVPSGLGPSGFQQIANPTVIQVTGINNTSTTAFSVGAPSFSGPAGVTIPAGAVTFTNAGSGFGSAPGSCGTTYAQLSSLPNSPLGPTCAWSLWVDATSLNSTDTTAQAACNGGFGIAGTVTFSPSGFPAANLVVPLTICVTDSPSIVLGMPNTFPNPTFGPFSSVGLNTNFAQPSNLVPGFPQSVVDMVLATSGGSLIPSTAAPINLLAQAGNSSQVCKILDIRTNGGVVNNVDIAPVGVQWLTIQSLNAVQGGAVFMGPGLTAGSAPNTFRFNSTGSSIGFNFGGGISTLGNTQGLPQTAPFAAGPVQVFPDFQTFAICVNTDPVGNVAGTFSTTVTINGAGVGAITIPVNMVISQSGTGGGTGGTGTADVFSQIGIFRPPTPVGGALGFFTLDKNGDYAFETTDKTTQFGLAGDYPVAGDWDGNGVIKIGVFRCPAPGAGVCTWYLDENNNGVWDGTFNGDVSFQFGLPGDIPVVGDWTGNGISKVGVMRCPAVGQPGVCSWYLDTQNLRAPNGAFLVDSYGLAGDQPAVGNWSATGGSKPVDNIGVFRNGLWIVDSNGSGAWEPSDTQYSYGVAGDVPVTGNWQGAGTKRIGVFRCPAAGVCTWILNTSGNGVFSASDLIATYGLTGDKPVVGFWTIP